MGVRVKFYENLTLTPILNPIDRDWVLLNYDIDMRNVASEADFFEVCCRLAAKFQIN